jgi:lipopolysaccharide heptosyltransferase II
MDRLGYAVYWLLDRIVGALPIEFGFRLGGMLGLLGYYVALPYRRLVLRNLRIAFGHDKSPAELRALAREHFIHLGANLLANLKLPRLSRAELESRVVVEGLETMEAGAIASGGFVMVISHLGSWEMFAQLSPIIFPCKVGTIFQALGNKFIDAEVRKDRARLGLELFERKEGFGKACQFMRAGGAVGVLVDQHAGDAGLWTPFFGRLASTSTLAATLALRTDAWLVPAAVYTAGVARWRCVIRGQMKPHGQDVETITARINRMLQDQIREQPADWFWVHNRWKTPKPKFLLAGYKRGVFLLGAEPVLGDQQLVESGDVLIHSPFTDHQSPSAPALQPFRMVIRSSNWLGDAVMSVPAVRAIKHGRIDAHVTILTPAKLADVWRRVPEVDEVLTFTPEESVFAVAHKLRAGNFDAAIIFPNSLRAALEPWLAGIPRRVSYPGHRRRWLLDQPFIEKRKKNQPLAPPPHQVHHYLALAKSIGAEITADDAVISDRRIVNGLAVAATIHQSPITNHPPILALVPGAEYGPAKRWLPERFAEVLGKVHEQTHCEWRMFGVEKDRAVADAITAASAAPITDRVGRTTLAGLMDELAQCDLLLTNDTGTMHLAALLGVPTVALFGSTEPKLTGPLGDRHHVIRHQVPCSPCFLRECPLDFRCMQAITGEEVTAAVLGQLKKM